MMKKQLIMEKSLELFAKKGFEATSVQQITDYCGISKGAFYLAFKSKDELIFSLIDHFMSGFVSDIDYMVSTADKEELLYQFFYKAFDSFHKHSDFAKILMKEQSHTLNQELFQKMHDYDRLLENVILKMINRLYGNEVQQTKYDLIWCIKGFLNTFPHLLLFHTVPIDLNVLSQSLVEKTNILAKQMKKPFLSEEFIEIINQPFKEEMTKERILELIDKKIKEIDSPIEKESLTLLRQQLIEPSLTAAIVTGLIKNIQDHPHCKWISYLLRRYFD